MKYLSLTLIFLSTILSGLYAQEGDITVTGDLNLHFDSLKNKSQTYDDYKVIKATRLDEFWVVVQDRVSQMEQELATAKETISNQQATTESLESAVAEKDEKLSESNYSMTHIEFMGFNFTKSSYILINVILISSLIVLIGVGFFQYLHNKKTASGKIKELGEIQRQFEDYKRNSLEKQVRLNRELQTERNMVEELRSKSTITKKITA